MSVLAKYKTVKSLEHWGRKIGYVEMDLKANICAK